MVAIRLPGEPGMPGAVISLAKMVLVKPLHVKSGLFPVASQLCS